MTGACEETPIVVPHDWGLSVVASPISLFVAGHHPSRFGITVERAKIDRVCGPSKQIIVIQKQDCAGLVSLTMWFAMDAKGAAGTEADRIDSAQ